MQLRSILQCPHCGFKVVEKLPVGDAPKAYECPACGRVCEVGRDDCCIFCRFGSVPCRRAQSQSDD